MWNTLYYAVHIILCRRQWNQGLQSMHEGTEEELTRPVDFVARATPSLSLILLPVMCRAVFFSAISLISRDASLPNSRSDRPGSYRETRGAKAWGRRWLHRCVEAGRSAATLDELLIWTNREAVGREANSNRRECDDSKRFSAMNSWHVLFFPPWRLLYAGD